MTSYDGKSITLYGAAFQSFLKLSYAIGAELTNSYNYLSHNYDNWARFYGSYKKASFRMEIENHQWRYNWGDRGKTFEKQLENFKNQLK